MILKFLIHAIKPFAMILFLYIFFFLFCFLSLCISLTIKVISKPFLIVGQLLLLLVTVHSCFFGFLISFFLSFRVSKAIHHSTGKCTVRVRIRTNETVGHSDTHKGNGLVITHKQKGVVNNQYTRAIQVRLLVSVTCV